MKILGLEWFVWAGLILLGTAIFGFFKKWNRTHLLILLAVSNAVFIYTFWGPFFFYGGIPQLFTVLNSIGIAIVFLSLLLKQDFYWIYAASALAFFSTLLWLGVGIGNLLVAIPSIFLVIALGIKK